MLNNTKTFQMVLVAVFIVLGFLGLLGFAGKLPLPSSNDVVDYGAVTMWGTIPQGVMQDVIDSKIGDKNGVIITYVEKNPATFSRDFVEALASGSGPDLFMIGQDELLINLNKLSFIPYTSITERDFKDTFIEEGELFMRPEGVAAVPLTIDPIMMYYNRDLLTNGSIVKPPTKWSEFYGLVPRVTMRDRAGSITKSFVAFGGYDNVAHAKDIIAMLLLQAGVGIVNPSGKLFASDLASYVQAGGGRGDLALAFYTEFSNPNKDSYSWNPSLPNSLDAFAAGDVGLYFGYASEYNTIRAKNPHLNFDVTLVPQTDLASRKVTFGAMKGVAVTKTTKNPGGALYASLLLGSAQVTGALAQGLNLPPIRRDLLTTRSTDPVLGTFYDAALLTKAWIDPSPMETSQIFKSMIGDIVSGRAKVGDALLLAQGSLTRTLSAYNIQQ